MSVSVWFLIRSELIAIQHSHCVGAALREEEKLLETESPSEKRNSPRILFGCKDAALPSEKVCISLRKARRIPASILQISFRQDVPPALQAEIDISALIHHYFKHKKMKTVTCKEMKCYR